MAPALSVEDPHRAVTMTKSLTESKKAFSLPGKPFSLFSTLPYYFLYVIYLGGMFVIQHFQNPYYVIAFIYLGIPILDYYSHDWLNPNREQHKQLERSLWFKLPLFGLVIIDNAVFLYALYTFTFYQFPWLFYPGAVFLTGSMAGHHFLVAHEIFHKHDKFHKIVGTLTILKSLYMHFYIEHNFGHHKNVGTLRDPATARYRESIYKFLPRTIIGSYKSAWNIEKKRLIEREGFKTHWILQNKMIWFTASYIIIPLCMLAIFGIKGFILYLPMVTLSFLIFESVNYIEHYGLTRKQIGSDEYEKVNITHSWNAPQRFSNYILFKLQRHSDHHENSYKPYQVLCSKDESPMLPHGYLLCIIIAYFPCVWFRMMDRVLLAYKEGRKPTEEEIKLNKKDTKLVFITLGVVFFSLCTLTNYFDAKYY